MKRRTFVANGVAAFAVAASARPARAAAAESDVTLTTASGTIAGTVALPARVPAPAVLIVAGSGPTDRNGNAPGLRTDTYRLLAAALAERGIASVRYDKRGVAGSATAAGREADLRFDTYADDAAAWLRMLHADVRFSEVVLAGHSEGALVGELAVQRAPARALVTLEGAGRPAATVLREQLKPKLPPELYAQADAIITALQHGRTVANPPAELDALFRASVQPYLISWFEYDPAVEIARVHIPLTVVQGTADVQVTMTDADALKRGDPAARLVVVDGMNHVLRYAPDISSPAAILQGYNASLPLDPKAVDAVATTVSSAGS